MCANRRIDSHLLLEHPGTLYVIPNTPRSIPSGTPEPGQAPRCMNPNQLADLAAAIRGTGYELGGTVFRIHVPQLLYPR